ncbi:4Fe-4S dicluster domain-containing protein [Clostridium sp. MT-14]|jgi:electron transport protein HydN|uniref:4Fe-4S dicluster domain-containing protein n=1 Tax=Clostridium aromativorans TaxID=2836848 RepID=A0ABS8N2R8_9CLOT|nr:MULTISPECIES: 4Fe-4S dicluster domain-containing protein [Clostridium]KAA8676540.1 4Fe-4S dicluster domain-containing protein [Clostridium sp. HV4-5-A1G]MCC9294109.1 4Fe-4S dicluster domain-containing protein [Clostridium aromativorans]CAB1239745.1 Electron transport protein HydN [Clostridiaceae bacterium BL-3]
MKPDLNSFVIVDPDKCIGCRACEIACAAKHREKNNQGRTIGTMNGVVTPRRFLVQNKGTVMPIQCRHCEDAPCANSCPVGAIVEKNGSIIVNGKKCIGCNTCALVCPVGAVNLLPRIESKIVTGGIGVKIKVAAYKCDLCKEEGGEPACVRECPEDALRVVDPRESKKDRSVKAALELLEVNGDV